jgi:pyrimidine operon attenuation protein/uracil phosphoribosyltransferase
VRLETTQSVRARMVHSTIALVDDVQTAGGDRRAATEEFSAVGSPLKSHLENRRSRKRRTVALEVRHASR